MGEFMELGFRFNMISYGFLRKTSTGFDVAVPNFSATDRWALTWIDRDLPAAALALLKNYTDPSKNISGKSYPVVNANMPYAELAARTGKGSVNLQYNTVHVREISRKSEEINSGGVEHDHWETVIKNPPLRVEVLVLSARYSTTSRIGGAGLSPAEGTG
ncbi:hypothetical protein FB451DRAFT_1429476 [Mycena latifolia]|nr:hypothetical protein FB451DRAFT_1429476 [Mycena latifolia]